ncbi:MAG: ribosome maturation factor RimP [Eubacteriaceae bacterium]|nr:ribosome maturation factor RimP [Eubacteriaceae bacterium]
MASLIDRAREAAEPLIEQCGCEIVDVEYKKEGAEFVLRFYVERIEGNIDIEDCVAVNKLLSRHFDEIGLLETNYVLEVSSPGVERVLKSPKDYARFSGSQVDLSLYKAHGSDGKKITCELLGYDEEESQLEFSYKDEKFKLKPEEIAKMNLHFTF